MNFPPEERLAIGVPPEAEYYAWSYPFPDVCYPGLVEKAGVSPSLDPDVAFLTIGGYLYFDKHHRLCQVNALRPLRAAETTQDANAVHFKPPLQLPQESVERLLRRPVHAVTLRNILEHNASYFCWIPQGADYGVDAEHGAFAYLGLGLHLPK